MTETVLGWDFYFFSFNINSRINSEVHRAAKISQRKEN